MNIAYFNDTYTPGMNGVIVSIKMWSQLLSKKHRIRVYVPSYGIENFDEKEGNVEIERYASLPVPFYKDFQMAMVDYFRLNRSLEEFKPDIIHIHSPGVMGMAGIALAKRHKIPLVGTYHALLSEALMYVSPLRLLPGIDIHEMTRTKDRERISQKITWNVMNRFFETCQMVIVPTLSVKKELAKHGMKADVRVISNGIETDLFPPKKEYVAGGRILHVGRLGFEKNVDLVIKAFARVVREMPEATLTIGGEGPARADLEDLTRKLGLKDKVTFLGWVDRNTLGEIHREADVFVTASAMETQGLVILEAMSSGLPVVGVDKYALTDAVISGKNGYLAKAGDVEGIAEYIVKLLKDPKLAAQMGKESRVMACEHDVHKVVTDAEKLYKEVVLKYHHEG